MKHIKLDLLEYKKNIYSQNGEDGIIQKIFEIIGTKNRIACEFGAWDGIHLSNTRNLILNGWTSIMIEGDKQKFRQLVKNYRISKNVFCVNRYVDTTKNSIFKILRKLPVPNILKKIDFLSIDIDGLDYEIFETLKISPRVICVEVSAAHYPNSSVKIQKEIAMNNVGQSLRSFSKIAKRKGYSLICYSGNAFYVKNNDLRNNYIQGLSDIEAYNLFIKHLDRKAKEWLFLANKGLVPPYYTFNNTLLSAKRLGIGVFYRMYITLRSYLVKYIQF